MTNIALPFPPSVNSIWRSRIGKGGKPRFFLDPKYEAWKKASDGAFYAAHPRPKSVAGAFVVSIVLDHGSSLRRLGADVDNRAKAVLDWLQRVKLIEDDKFAEKVTIEWGLAPEGCRVEIEASASSIKPDLSARAA